MRILTLSTVSLYSSGSAPQSGYSSPAVAPYPIPRDLNSRPSPTESSGIRLPNAPLNDIATMATPPSHKQSPYFQPSELPVTSIKSQNLLNPLKEQPTASLADQFGQLNVAGHKGPRLQYTNPLTSLPDPQESQQPPPEIILPPNATPPLLHFRMPTRPTSVQPSTPFRPPTHSSTSRNFLSLL